MDNKYEGNVAMMHEALEPWIAFAEWLLENAGKDALGVAIRDNGPIIRQRLEELRAALSAPQRNCYKMLHTAWFVWTASPSGMNPDGTVKLTFAEWLLAPELTKGGAV